MSHVAAISIIFTIASVVLEAQPRLDFFRVVTNWPTIELYFVTYCDSSRIFFQDKRNVRVLEDGREMDFELWCPDTTSRCAISISTFIDVGTGMSDDNITAAKQAVRSIIENLDGVFDEAAIISSDSGNQIRQSMTTIKPRLFDAVTILKRGTNALWDGIHVSISELIANGVNPCRSVLVFSNGKDSGSVRNVNDLISLANRNRIPIYIFAFDDSSDLISLRGIAETTGGKVWLHPTAGDMDDLYRTISTIIFKGFKECLVTYTSRCMDGSTREISLQVVGICGETETRTRTYKAPKDSASFAPLDITIPSKHVEEERTFVLPITLVPPIGENWFRAAQFTLAFDSTALSFIGVETDATTILQDSLIQYASGSSGINFTTQPVFVRNQSRVLMRLVFRANSVTDSVEARLSFEAWQFSGGCYLPVAQPGIVTVHRKGTLSTTPVTHPNAISLHQNYPNPFNPGTTIEYDIPSPMDVRLVVYDALGRIVHKLVNARMNAGSHRVEFRADGAASGVYHVHLEAGGIVRTMVMVALR